MATNDPTRAPQPDAQGQLSTANAVTISISTSILTAIICLTGMWFITKSKSDDSRETAVTSSAGPSPTKSEMAKNTLSTEPDSNTADSAGSQPKTQNSPLAKPAETTPFKFPDVVPKAYGLQMKARITVSKKMPNRVTSAGKNVSFSGDMVVDKMEMTSWGIPGDGSGESITFEWDQPVSIYHLGIGGGYSPEAASEMTDYDSRQPTKVLWKFDDGSTYEQRFGNLNGIQQVDPLNKPRRVSKVTMTIQETSTPKGSSDSNTYVNEIAILGVF